MEAKAIRYSEEINDRFFKAFEALVKEGTIRSMNWFCEEYGFYRIKYIHLRNKNSPDDRYKYVDAAAVGVLIRDFNVSPEWIFRGEGEMFYYSGTLRAVK